MSSINRKSFNSGHINDKNKTKSNISKKFNPKNITLQKKSCSSKNIKTSKDDINMNTNMTNNLSHISKNKANNNNKNSNTKKGNKPKNIPRKTVPKKTDKNYINNNISKNIKRFQKKGSIESYPSILSTDTLTIKNNNINSSKKNEAEHIFYFDFLNNQYKKDSLSYFNINKNNNIIIENKNDDYSQLIQKMADLSEKQVILIDCLSQLRNDFLNITSNLNNRVEKLEKILLNPNSSFNNFNNGFNKNYYNKNNFSNNNFSINNFNNYINDPIQNLIDENNLNSLLNNLSKFNFEDLNEIPIQTLENVIYYFIHKIQNEKNIPLDKIISIFKKIMIGLKNKIANDCKENLEHTLKKILNDLNMNEDNVIEIKLILSYLKN